MTKGKTQMREGICSGDTAASPGSAAVARPGVRRVNASNNRTRRDDEMNMAIESSFGGGWRGSIPDLWRGGEDPDSCSKCKVVVCALSLRKFFRFVLLCCWSICYAMLRFGGAAGGDIPRRFAPPPSEGGFFLRFAPCPSRGDFFACAFVFAPCFLGFALLFFDFKRSLGDFSLLSK